MSQAAAILSTLLRIKNLGELRRAAPGLFERSRVDSCYEFDDYEDSEAVVCAPLFEVPGGGSFAVPSMSDDGDVSCRPVATLNAREIARASINMGNPDCLCVFYAKEADGPALVLSSVVGQDGGPSWLHLGVAG